MIFCETYLLLQWSKVQFIRKLYFKISYNVLHGVYCFLSFLKKGQMCSVGAFRYCLKKLLNNQCQYLPNQCRGQQFSRVLIGSCNLLYPWIFTVLGTERKMACCFANVSEEEIEEVFFFYPSDLVSTKTTIPLRVGEEQWIYSSTLRTSIYIHHYSPPLRGIVVYYSLLHTLSSLHQTMMDQT